MLGCLGSTIGTVMQTFDSVSGYITPKILFKSSSVREGYYEQGMSPVFLSARIEPLLFYERKLKSLAELKLRKTTFTAVIINSL